MGDSIILPAKKPTVWIFADASLDTKTGIGGWGCHVKSVRSATATVTGGTFEGPTQCPNAAELKALAMACHIARAANMIEAGDHILLMSDSLVALMVLRRTLGANNLSTNDGALVPVYGHKNKGSPIPPRFLGPANKMQGLIFSVGTVAVSVRHVTGHAQGGGPRQKISRRVDGIARAAMRAARGKVVP